MEGEDISEKAVQGFLPGSVESWSNAVPAYELDKLRYHTIRLGLRSTLLGGKF